jgi:hypothetical protein
MTSTANDQPDPPKHIRLRVYTATQAGAERCYKAKSALDFHGVPAYVKIFRSRLTSMRCMTILVHEDNAAVAKKVLGY